MAVTSSGLRRSRLRDSSRKSGLARRFRETGRKSRLSGGLGRESSWLGRESSWLGGLDTARLARRLRRELDLSRLDLCLDGGNDSLDLSGIGLRASGSSRLARESRWASRLSGWLRRGSLLRLGLTLVPLVAGGLGKAGRELDARRLGRLTGGLRRKLDLTGLDFGFDSGDDGLNLSSVGLGAAGGLRARGLARRLRRELDAGRESRLSGGLGWGSLLGLGLTLSVARVAGRLWDTGRELDTGRKLDSRGKSRLARGLRGPTGGLSGLSGGLSRLSRLSRRTRRKLDFAGFDLLLDLLDQGLDVVEVEVGLSGLTGLARLAGLGGETGGLDAGWGLDPGRKLDAGGKGRLAGGLREAGGEFDARWESGSTVALMLSNGGGEDGDQKGRGEEEGVTHHGWFIVQL